MAKSSDYWEKRFEQLENASNSYGLATYRDVEISFDKAQREINKEIESWYGRLAKNNEVSIQEARKMLSFSELKEFHWDVNEYIKYGQENAIDGRWIKELENASAKYHISRLEALKVRTQQAVEVAFGNELDAVDSMARKVFSDTYYHSIFEIQKGFNIGCEVGRIDEKILNKIIKKPWAADGKNFSDRIWQSKNQLINELHTELTRNCILGKAPDEVIKHIAKKFDVSKSQAGRLVMTEEAFFHSVSQKEAFKNLGVEQYEICATLDIHTSEICRELDGKVFPMGEYAPGSTAPPFHPWCRSVTIPHFDDNYGGERTARDENGNTYYVPDNMTYKQWEKQFVKENRFNAFDITENGKYQRINSNQDVNAYADCIEHEYTTQRMTVKEVNRLWDKDVGYIQSTGYSDINEYLRELKPKLDKPKRNVTINILKRITNNNSLVNDYIGIRKVDVSYLENVLGIDTSGLLKNAFRKDGMGRKRKQLVPKDSKTAQHIVDAINSLVGTYAGTITDKAFTSVSLDETLNYFSHYPIKFEIQMPKGTKGMITSNLQESEFIAKNESSIEIIGSKVYNDNKDNCILIYARLKQ